MKRRPRSLSPIAATLGIPILLLLGCEEEMAREEPVEPGAEARATAPDREGQRKIIAFGDSLTAGLGLALDEAYPAQLQALIDERGLPYEVINSGVSGETTAGGLRRIGWALGGYDEVAVVVVALGGNDGLRGLPVDSMKENLRGIISEAEGRGVQVLLAAILPPPDRADDYTLEFTNVFPELAEEAGVALLPFMLEGVVGVQELNQPDGIHPNREGARLVAETVFRHLEPLLAAVPAELPE